MLKQVHHDGDYTLQDRHPELFLGSIN